MQNSTGQSLDTQLRAMKAFRLKIRKNPEVAKKFLLDAGILVISRKSKGGVILAKRYRSKK
ncbi:MAG: hypothetical protein HC898_12745 [Phycisphaerales bacterium]|nr:hypothetical protein [Phycisphaerales bacterium]